jgi:hypothetical protein
MEKHTLEPVLHSFAYGLDFLREQLADVNAPAMVAQPNDIMNHPSWGVNRPSLLVLCSLIVLKISKVEDILKLPDQRN